MADLVALERVAPGAGTSALGALRPSYRAWRDHLFVRHGTRRRARRHRAKQPDVGKSHP